MVLMMLVVLASLILMVMVMCLCPNSIQCNLRIKVHHVRISHLEIIILSKSEVMIPQVIRSLLSSVLCYF
uniref:Secreted protein n=1 Tax=Octopus bimaculoides TaxID=37653 RepID=A0A0L8HXQ4_OCTBM